MQRYQFDIVSGRSRTKFATETHGDALLWIQTLLEQAQSVCIDVVYENERRWSAQSNFNRMLLLPTERSARHHQHPP